MTCLIEKGNNLNSFKYTWHNEINGNKFLRLDIYNTIVEVHFKSDNGYKKKKKKRFINKITLIWNHDLIKYSIY